MEELQKITISLDGQHDLTPIWIKGRIRPIAVFIEANGPSTTANIKQHLLAKITKEHLVFSKAQSLDSFEIYGFYHFRDNEWRATRMKLIEILLQMPKTRPAEGETLQATIKPLRDLLNELEAIQTDLDRRYEESMDPEAHQWAHLFPTCEQKQQLLINQNLVKDKRKKFVETNRFASAFGILLSQEKGFSLTVAVNQQLETLGQQPLSKKMIAKYVKSIRQMAATKEGQKILSSILGEKFPIDKLLIKTRTKNKPTSSSTNNKT